MVTNINNDYICDTLFFKSDEYEEVQQFFKNFWEKEDLLNKEFIIKGNKDDRKDKSSNIQLSDKERL